MGSYRKKRQRTVKKGMSAEILIKNTNAKPSSEQIAKALSEKYGEINASAGSVHFFEIEEIK